MARPSSHRYAALCALLLGVFFATGAARASDQTLPALNAEIDQTSVSGISSGAYMAVQFGVAWSSIVKGVGAVAGGPFGCADGSASTALSTCMLGVPAIDLATLIHRTDAWSHDGAIDDTANLARQKIYLFSGYNDAVVLRPVVDSLQAFYLHYLGADHRANLFYQTAIGAGHAQVTVAYGGRCAENGGAYINRCRYDQAGIILRHIYGALHAPTHGTLSGHLEKFDQGAFTRPLRPADDSLGDTGFVYVPQACAAMEACRVHVALHGCQQSYGDIGESYVMNAGYNAWADSNHIIVLYPQTQADFLTPAGGSNPEACWDWWGYLDTNPMADPTYLLKSGRQISAIKAMVDRLTSGARPPPVTVAAARDAPGTVLAADASDSAIDLVWSAVPGATSYDVFRAGPDEPALQRIGSVDGLSYGDSALLPATQYRYQVRASAPEVGALSAVVATTTRPAVPRCVQPGSCPVH